MPDIGEALTRKLGPLPTWAWGGVVGGAVLGVRLLTGGRGGASGGAVASVGGDGADLPTPGSSGGFDFGDTPSAGGDPIGGVLPGVVDSIADFSGFAALQQQLSASQQSLSSLQTARANEWRIIADIKQNYSAGKISAATRDRQLADHNAKVATLNGQITTTTSTIDSLRAQIAAIFAAPAAE